MTPNPPLPSGYSPVALGQIATVVTCLEMTERPRPKPPRHRERPLLVEPWLDRDIAAYRAQYRAVGDPWLWFSRLFIPDDELRAILGDPAVRQYRLFDGRRPIGFLELDFRKAGECELAYFGVVADAIGTGAGRVLMDRALQEAWSRPIGRMWVHTCSLDHPGAVAFYTRSGFTPYALMVEIADDPRLTGHLPTSAAPHVPLIRA